MSFESLNIRTDPSLKMVTILVLLAVLQMTDRSKIIMHFLALSILSKYTFPDKVMNHLRCDTDLKSNMTSIRNTLNIKE